MSSKYNLLFGPQSSVNVHKDTNINKDAIFSPPGISLLDNQHCEYCGRGRQLIPLFKLLKDPAAFLKRCLYHDEAESRVFPFLNASGISSDFLSLCD